MTWPLTFNRKASCVSGYGMAVDTVRGLVVVSGDADKKLYMYSLRDGSYIRCIGERGSGKCQFNWSFGGLCITCRGTLLVAERYNDRVQEIDIDEGRHVRFIGLNVLVKPDCVDSNESVIAVTETEPHCVTLLSWSDESVLARFGGEGSRDGQLNRPRGLRLLSDGSGVVVADRGNDRLCLFSMTGVFMRAVAVTCPRDVVECDGGTAFLVANCDVGTVSKVKIANDALPVGESVQRFGARGSDAGQFDWPASIVVSKVAEMVEVVVLDTDNERFQVFQTS